MRALTIAMLATLTFAAGAYAEPPSPNTASASPAAAAPVGSFSEACGADVQKLCPTAQSRRDQKHCLKHDRQKLSSTCSAYREAKREQHMAKKREEQTSTPAAPQTPPSGH